MEHLNPLLYYEFLALKVTSKKCYLYLICPTEPQTKPPTEIVGLENLTNRFIE